MAQGAWIGLLDHDDLLAPNALYEMVAQMNQEPQTEALYSDEDQVEETRHGLEHKKPHFKPDFSPDLLRSTTISPIFFVLSARWWSRLEDFEMNLTGLRIMILFYVVLKLRLELGMCRKFSITGVSTVILPQTIL